MFFDDQVLELLRSSTEQNAIAKGHVNFRLTIEEVKNFIVSGYNSVSRYRMYWDQSIDTHHSGVATCMTPNRFEELLRFFHACDNSSLPPDDKFGKVRPLWDMMNERWLKFFPGDKHLSIDESMVPYFGKHGTKQHIHGKPIRFGYKIWSLCTRLGYLIYGEPYQGAKTGNTNPNLGVGGSVVTNLISKLPTAAHYSFYTDNFFTSLRLLDDVSQMGHDITGTLRANRTEVPLENRKTVNSEKYTTICLPEALEEIRINNRQRRIILHHDYGSYHTSAETVSFLEGQKIELTDHPPYSPDLASNDFYLFPSVKNKLRGQRFSSREEAVDAFEIHVLEIRDIIHSTSARAQYVFWGFSPIAKRYQKTFLGKHFILGVHPSHKSFGSARRGRYGDAEKEKLFIDALGSEWKDLDTASHVSRTTDGANKSRNGIREEY
ncbi:PiggyBac transposable element-derived protein 3 [Eumeta japonica]|uniref:PiggyBac transposable element-derived protein 3 n=1 Tax=Eumeta variegata TaxID=151549 RepID=A0A4C1XVW6_EUMVA|nr:PiggyBac transposable element-derived protein 3 [Eumeta japonica]